MTFHYERRLDRALYHLESFEAETAVWREEHPHRTWTELDNEIGKKFLWAEIVKSPPDRLGLIAGDCIHNFRSALDNLVFQLALACNKGRLSSDIERNSGFPILSNDIFPPEGIDIDEVEYLFNTFDSRAPIARYPALDSTGAEVEMGFSATFDVCFDVRAPKSLWMRSIPDTLKVIRRHIVNKVLPPLEDFLT